MNWQEILIAVITAILPVITGYVVAYFNSKIKDLKSKSNNEAVNITLDCLDNLIATIVQATNQTIVDNAKKEGKFNKEFAENVFNQTKQTIVQSATDEMKNAVEKMYGVDFSKWLDSKIEAVVKSQK